jgi:hypothetical protein
MRVLFGAATAAIGAAAIAVVLIGCPGIADSYLAVSEGGASLPPVQGPYAAEMCGQCVIQACTSHVNDCEQDADCSAYLRCYENCPLDVGGMPEPVCAGQCLSATPQGSLATAFADCARSAQETCSACAGRNPILHQTCTPMTDTTPCYTCEDDQCCQTYETCSADPDCKALKGCLTDCLSGVADDAGSPGAAPDGGSCEVICGQAHPKGLIEWAPRLTCLSVLCPAACGTPPSACQTCVYQKCADAFANLNGTPQGYLFNSCVGACPTGANACTAACAAQYPTAQAASQALTSCISANCPVCS